MNIAFLLGAVIGTGIFFDHPVMLITVIDNVMIVNILSHLVFVTEEVVPRILPIQEVLDNLCAKGRENRSCSSFLSVYFN